MKDTWHNNRISLKLNTDYKKDFSICDIDGLVRCNYGNKTRFIIYESKNKNEKKMGDSQLLSLRTLDNAIDWTKFDEYSGVFVLQIIDLENEIIWYNLKGVEIRKTNFKELYNLFSCK
jgi:hypothetical protein